MRFLLIIFSLFFVQTSYARTPEWIDTLSRHESINSQPELACMALAVYYEARGESPRGKMAVAQVVLNRSRSSVFPSSICDVIFQKSQFSFVKGRHVPLRPTSTTSWADSIDVAKRVMNKPTGDRWLYFCDCRRSGHRIGNHVFY